MFLRPSSAPTVVRVRDDGREVEEDQAAPQLPTQHDVASGSGLSKEDAALLSLWENSGNSSEARREQLQKPALQTVRNRIAADGEHEDGLAVIRAR